VQECWVATRDERTVKYFSLSSDKIESDPVLIRKIFENHQSDQSSPTSPNVKSFVFILPHEAK